MDKILQNMTVATAQTNKSVREKNTPWGKLFQNQVTLDMSIFHTFKNFDEKYPYWKIEEDQNEISISLDINSSQR